MRRIVFVIMLTSLLAGTIFLTFHIRPAGAAAETVYVKSDGSVSPSSAPISSVDNITYTFTGDISYPTYLGIVVQRSNIVINGNGYTVQGNQSGKGLSLTGMGNVTIKNITIQNFQDGIYLSGSNNNTITGNNASVNGNDGIALWFSSNNIVIGNTAAVNNGSGIHLIYSDSNNVTGNSATTNYCGINIDWSSNDTVIWNNATANTYYGIRVYSSTTIVIIGNNASANTYYGIHVYSSSSNTVSGNTATANSNYGIDLYISSNCNNVTGNNATANSIDGIYVYSSSSNTVSGNTATANSNHGILLDLSSNNTVRGNNATANSLEGIYIARASNDIVSGNTVTANQVGLMLWSSSNDTISGNNATANWNGIAVDSSSSYDTFIGNTVTNSQYGILFDSSLNNTIYHDNFLNNTHPVGSNNSTNTWDKGYPSGGNYWSNWNATDSYRGLCQNQTGSDGIGDTAYVIDVNNTDHYPLMGPFGPATNTGTNSTVFPSDDVGLVFANVTSAGGTFVSEMASGPDSPPGRKMIGPCYNISTSAAYSGNVQIRIIYDATGMTLDSARLRMLELMDWNGSGWINITTSVDIANHVIYGESTHLSPHGITSVLIDDVSIIGVVPQKTVVNQGETLGITVSVWNTGDFQEDFSVTLYANGTINRGPIPLGTLQVTGMQVGASSGLIFTWNTVSFPPDDYTIWAHLYSGEIDNVYVYGTVQIIGGGGGGGRMPYMD
jgi:parallel beta-helix repeat protein